ncbi:LuxR C-terminal-related transcriptional regulator [Rhizobium sp. S152]|uniref:helix-turn-helix transcriptional regulator n=1 Tax=Rhizobium sp. S152 TaxID=3055038 RepID=UPI0025A9752A|nr:LuxR C-terminal-related transcriptional regulator [Rhizobium sp. S152]MDM9626057.1 LuxR C-terminal-related transcriptional regulator [Rhizobium sp. S152]
MPRSTGSARKGADENILSFAASGDSAFANDADEYLGEMARSIGFDYYLLSSFPRGDRTGFLANRLASNWPGKLLAFYEQADVFYCSGMVTKLKSTIMPVFCDGVPFEGTSASRRGAKVTEFMRLNGLKSTLAFTLHDADRRQYIFAFSGERKLPSREEASAQIVRAIEFLETFGHNNPVEQPAENLSGREVECLRWSAAGKSSEEIAIILELSSHTVVGYLKSAMRKLDSVNRMQAVARALRYRLI